MRREQNAEGVSEAASTTLDGLELTGVREVGQGAGATVFAGTQQRYGRQVAVKIFRVPLMDEDTRDQFVGECKILGLLSNHPNIAKLFGSGFDAAGHPFIVMGLYEGGCLQQRLLRSGPMPVARVLQIGVKLCSALQFAHSRGILHRDIKPANVLLMAFGEPVLSDFHLTGVESSETSWSDAEGQIPIYAAPEVLENGDVGVTSDIWSLAATLYALLIGHAPYSDAASGSAQLRHPIGHGPLPALGRDDVPPELAALLAAGMAKDPAGRPQSAALFAAALQRVQHGAGLAVTAYVDREPPPPAPTRSRDREAAFRPPRTGVPPTAMRLAPATAVTTSAPLLARRRAGIVAAVVVLVAGAAALVGVRAVGHHRQPKLLADEPPAVTLPALPTARLHSSCRGFTCTFTDADASLPAGTALNLTFPGHRTESLTTTTTSHDFATAGRFVVLAQVVDGSRRGAVVRNVVVLRNWSRSVRLASGGSTNRHLLVRVQSRRASCGAGQIRFERRTGEQLVVVSTHKARADGTLPLVAPRPGPYRAVAEPMLVSGGRCQGERSRTVEIQAPVVAATTQTVTPTQPSTPVPVTPPPPASPSPPATPRRPASPPP